MAHLLQHLSWTNRLECHLNREPSARLQSLQMQQLQGHKEQGQLLLVSVSERAGNGYNGPRRRDHSRLKRNVIMNGGRCPSEELTTSYCITRAGKLAQLQGTESRETCLTNG